MHEFLVQWWDALILPVFAFVLIVVWGVRQWSVVCHFWEQFRSQSGESDKLHVLNSFALGVLSFILGVLFFGVLAAVGKLGISLLSPGERDDESLRWLGLTIFGLLTALGGILGAPLAIIRINATERQTRVEEEETRIKSEEADIKKREHTTSLINQATEHLGASLGGTDPVKPNIPLRIGGLLALERIAQDNAEDYHLQVMDMICSYIQDNSSDSKSGAGKSPLIKGKSDYSSSIRIDVQYAIDVLTRRASEHFKVDRLDQIYQINLDRTNLTDADFTRRNQAPDFSYASFRNCSLVRAIFWEVDLTRAFLMRTDLTGADLRGAHLTDADLTGANLTGAHLMDTDLTGANLTGVKLTGADLTATDLKEANLTGANLTGATVTRAKFDNTRMERIKPSKSVILEYIKKDGPLPSEEDSD